MKKHIAYLIGIISLILLLSYLVSGRGYILNEQFWKTGYTPADIEGGSLKYSELDVNKDDLYLIVELSDSLINRLDFLGLFKIDNNSLYVDFSNKYIFKVEGNLITQKIYIDEDYGEIKDLVSDSLGNIYAHAVTYDKYASWILKEQILKFNSDGKFAGVIYEIQYDKENMLYLTGSIKGLSYDEKGLRFFDQSDNTLDNYSYNGELNIEYSVDLTGKGYKILDVFGNEPGQIIFTNSMSQVGIIDQDLSINIAKDYMKEKKIISGFTPIEDGHVYIKIDSVGYSQLELMINSDSGSVFQLIASGTKNTSAMLDSLKSGYDISKGLYYTNEVITMEYMIVAAYVLMILLALYGIRFFYKYIMQGKMYVVLKQLMVLIPVILIIMLILVLRTVISGFNEFGNEIRSGKYDQFNQIIDYQLEQAKDTYGYRYITDFFQSVTPYEEISADEYIKFYDAMSLEKLVHSATDLPNSQILEDIEGMYVVIDRVYKGVAYKILDTENNFKMFTIRPYTNQYFQKALEGNQVNSIGTNSEYIFSMRPIHNSDGEIVGIIQVGMKYAGYRKIYDTNMIMGSIYKILFITGLLVVSITLITLWTLRSISRLTKGVRAVSDGDLEVSIDIKSNDEISELAHAFNSMTGNLKDYINNMVELNESYYRFIPQEIFKLLGVDDIRGIEKGISSQFDLVIMSVAIENFYDLTKDMSDKESFELINKHLNSIGPIIRKYEGVIDHYMDIGLVALFPSEVDKAIKAAIEINELFHTKSNGEDVFYPLNIALHKSNVLIGIIGEEKRLQSSIISDDLNVLSRIINKSVSLYSQIMITENVFNAIEEKSDYNYRKIGAIDFDGYSKDVVLYDLYSFKDNSDSLMKESYSQYFNKGIELFEIGDYYSARAQFVKVLESNITDGAARIYFYESDKRYRAEESLYMPLRM